MTVDLLDSAVRQLPLTFPATAGNLCARTPAPMDNTFKLFQAVLGSWRPAKTKKFFLALSITGCLLASVALAGSETHGGPSDAFGTLSGRGHVGTGDNVLISGFIGQFQSPKRVLVRALGPSLSASGVSGVLADPTLELYDVNGTLIASNDNWRDTQEAEIQATGHAPSNNLESAVLRTLSGGAHTAVLRGANSTGVGMAEVIDVDTTNPGRLVNISTRVPVGTADKVAVAGFTINGPQSQRVIIRGIGPSLGGIGVSNPLQNPTLRLRDGSGNTVVFNDNWRDTQEAELQATGLPPSDNRESAIVATLPPGSYTAVLAGVCGTTGSGLAEVYDLGLAGSSTLVPASSSLPNCGPVPVLSVVSHKPHGSGGAYGVVLPLSGSPGIECRTGGVKGEHTVIFNFANTLESVGGANITAGTGDVLSSGIGTDTRQYVVNLTGVANAQIIQLRLSNVTDSFGLNSNEIAASMGVLLGDTNANGTVTAADVGQTKGQAGQGVGTNNFRSDVTANGAINAADIGIVKAQSGAALPAGQEKSSR